MLRAVVDTNVWVSALLNPNGHPAAVSEAFRNGRFVSILSQPLIEELIDVLSRPRIVEKYHLAPDKVAEYVAFIVEKPQTLTLPGTLHLCRDPRDNAILETALAGLASFLVSRDDDVKGDEDLVLTMERQGVSVLSVARFLARLQETR